MPERPFICTPSSWLYSPKLNRVSLLAEALFRRLAQCTDQDWRFSADPLVIRGEAVALRPEIRLRDVVRALDELRASGALVYSQSGGHEWLTVADDLRYHKGAHADARWGDPSDGALEQGDLPLIMEAKAPPQRPQKPRSKRAAAAPVAPHVLPAPQGSPSSPPTDTPQNPQIPKSEPAGYPTSARIAGEDMLMFDLGELIGPDAIENGGIWRNRFRTDRVAMQEAMGDLKIAKDQGAAITNPPAWLTDRFGRISQQRKSA